MSQLNSTEQTTIQKAIAGNSSAYRYLLDKHKTFAFSIAIRIVKNREDAEEVVQDSFIKAFKALRIFKGSGKFSTWLYRIVYNTSLTRIRNNKILMNSIEEFPGEDYKFDIPDNYEDTFEKLVRAERVSLLTQALESLNETDSLMITLYYTCDNSIMEIASITGWNSSTIKTTLFRARQKLYVELSKILKEEIKELI